MIPKVDSMIAFALVIIFAMAAPPVFAAGDGSGKANPAAVTESSWHSPSLTMETVTGPNGAVTTRTALSADARLGVTATKIAEQVAAGVYALRGWGIAHSFAIEAPNGWIVVDTGDSTRAAAEMREMLERAVDDIVPLKPASMLSGGIDSTALTALMRRRMQRVDSFSVDYEGNAEHFRGTSFQPERDEPYIELAVSRIGTNHLKVVLAQDELISSLEAAVDARGFPGMADVDGSLLQFARRIAPRARFIVSGECGDEVFGGYPWFRDAASLSADAFPWSGSMELRCRILKKRVRDKLRPKAYARAAVLNAIDRVEHLPREPAADKCLRTMQHMCFEFFMANLQERAASMCAYSHLGALTPFADERLVQYVYNAPWEMKFLGGREKGLLREAVKDILPEPLVYRKSSPYPRTCSPEYARMAVDLMREMLADRTNPILVFVDPDALEGAFSTDAPWFGQLMAGPQMLAYLWQVNFWMRSRRVEVSL